MSFVSLFNDERGFLATDQRVFSAEELSVLNSVVEQSATLSQRLATQSQTVEEARLAAQGEGRVSGMAEGQAEARESLAANLVELHRKHTQVCERLQNESAQLAVDIVRKIAGQIAPSDWLLAQAVQAAEELVDYPVLSLRVHADQQESIRSRCESQSISRFVSVIADHEISHHACIIETSAGRVEIDLETQLAQVLNMLRDGKDSDEH